MATSADRKGMNGVPHESDLDASDNSGPLWRKPPTTIPTPSNKRIGHASGSNPYNTPGTLNLKKQSASRNNASAGNPTSRQTLATTTIDRHSGPPTKRQKRVHSSEDHKPKTVKTIKKPIRPPLANDSREVIDVDEDYVKRKARNDYQRRQSSDELNIQAADHHIDGQPSKYPFRSTEHRASIVGIVPDGENTKFIDHKYGAQSVDSDPIEDFTSESLAPRVYVPETRTFVKSQIEAIEAKNLQVPPKVDLSSVPKLHGKARLKPRAFRPAGSPIAPINRSGVRPFVYKDMDPIATSTTLKPSRQGPLPVKEAYVNDRHYVDTYEQALELFWSPQNGISLGQQKVVFKLSLLADSDYEMKCSSCGSLIQFEPTNSENDLLVTIKFETSNNGWTAPKRKQFSDFINKTAIKVREVRNADLLWDQAEQRAMAIRRDNFQVADAKPDRAKSERMKELNEILQTRAAPDLGHSTSKSTIPKNISESQSVNTIQKDPNSKDKPSVPAPPAKYDISSTAQLDISQTFTGPSTRRRSARNIPPETKIRAADQDEVILVYPQGVPGAVNVTNGDLARLEPGEFLNDTLIEFGLKLWLKELEKSHPEIAKQIHVFNSFFYKKLNSKKDPRQAYESVRKWTSKFDIFQKKYIIVPINEHFHWYLAVIYEPEHILSSTVPESPSLRKNTRSSTKNAVADEVQSLDLPLQAENDEEDKLHQTSSEAEVERNLSGFQNSCNIDETIELPVNPIQNDETGSHSALSYMSDPNDRSAFPGSRAVSPTASDFGRYASASRRLSIPSNDIAMDEPDELLLVQSKGKDGRNALSEENLALLVQPERTSISAPVPSASFYQPSAKAKGKQKATLDSVPMDVDEENKAEVIFVDETPQTQIFTLDSLGTSHRAVVNKLALYLQKEAEDKKGIKNAGLAKGKQAFVPVQPNFCDCGVYLLHFAQTFMSDPKRYIHISMATKSKSHKDSQGDWGDHKVARKREELAGRIRALSIEWKKTRIPKGETEDKDDSSDSDVKVLSQPKKGKSIRLR